MNALLQTALEDDEYGDASFDDEDNDEDNDENTGEKK